uniref:Uncharacterized protein n=1 Tax=viral metagenome TaxID=1070528 RepID=A0A6C0LFI4_9ZZZZ
MEFVIYSLLFLVLIAFIGVIGYIIYDNYTYKNNLTTDLNTNFVDINQNFHSTSNILGRLDNKHTSNYNVLDDRIGNTSNLLNQQIYDANNLFNQQIGNTSNLLNQRIYDSSNLLDGSIKDVNRKSTTNFDTFGYNMNKYFAFNNTTVPFNDTNKKIFEYRTVAGDTNTRLDLITKTTATSGLTVNSDSNNGLEVCNKAGTNCFNMYGNDNDLYIYGKNTNNMNRNIYIGSNDKTNAPIRIENNIVKVNGENISTLRADVNTLRADVDALRSSSHTHTKVSAEAAVKIAKEAQTEALKKASEAVTAQTAAAEALVNATTAEDTAIATKGTADAEVARTAGVVSSAGTGATPEQRTAADNAVKAQTAAATNVITTGATKITAIETKGIADAEVEKTAAVKKSADAEVIRMEGILATFG